MKLYEKIYAELKEQIHANAFSGGELLPTEKALQQKYKVSRITVKHAYQLLEEQGYIERIPGKGTVLKNLLQKPGKRLIGVIFCDFDSAFGERLIKSIEITASKKGYRILLARSFDDHTNESRILADFISLGVSGILIQNCHGNFTKNLIELFVREFPVVSIDRYAKGLLIPSVTSDNFQGSMDAAEFLFRKGHKSILYVSSNPDYTSTLTERLDGFQKMFMMKNIPLNTSLLLTDIPSPGVSGQAQTQEEIDKIKNAIQATGCTAVFASERFVAELCLNAINSLEHGSPNRPELVCFDYPNRFSKEVECTYIQQNEEEMGKRAVANLCSIIDGGEVELRSVVASHIVHERFPNHTEHIPSL